MKAEAILKAIGQAEGRGMATEALSNRPAGGMPADIPAEPDTEAMGPPEVAPPVEIGEAPEFDDATGLPFIAMENAPDEFPADADSNGAAGPRSETYRGSHVKSEINVSCRVSIEDE